MFGNNIGVGKIIQSQCDNNFTTITRCTRDLIFFTEKMQNCREKYFRLDREPETGEPDTETRHKPRQRIRESRYRERRARGKENQNKMCKQKL